MDLRPFHQRDWNKLNSGEPLPRDKQPKRSDRNVLPDEYFVERILTKKNCIKEGKLFLVHWKDYSLHDVTWEPKNHIPSSKLEEFENPDPSLDKLKVYASLLEEAVQTNLGSTNSNIVITFPTDIYKYIFGSFESVFANRDTFENKLCLSKFWYCKYNIHGQGVQLDFPVKVESTVYNKTVYIPENNSAKKTKVPVERLLMKTSTSVI